MTSRTRLAALLGAVLLAISLFAAPTSADPPRQQDLADRIRDLPGVVSVRESAFVPEGYRFFVIRFRQPVDHHDPDGPSFVQRLTLLHRDEARPMVMYTGGYYVYGEPFLDEPTEIVDGNQLSMEYRFFRPSRPRHPDWARQLTIWQAAADEHRVIESFRQLYPARWISTGASKGGMTATYHRRFFPDDVDGTIAYVAPDDVDNDRDSYNRFLARVGSERCRDALTAVQRRILGPDRDWFLDRTRRTGGPARILGGPDRAMEVAVVDLYFTFWQYSGPSRCHTVPGPAATRPEVYRWTRGVLELDSYFDADLRDYQPYYYQAATQLGWPEPRERPLHGVLRHPGAFGGPEFVQQGLKPLRFDEDAMRDIDRWVRTESTEMLFVYGGVDPWGAERFSCGTDRPGERECLVRTVPGGTHGAQLSSLPAAQRERATDLLLSWAGLPPGSERAPYDPRLERPDPARSRPIRPA